MFNDEEQSHSLFTTTIGENPENQQSHAYTHINLTTTAKCKNFRKSILVNKSRVIPGAANARDVNVNQ